jgi:hypothetical protein
MWALETLAIYLTPFLIIGIAVRLLTRATALTLPMSKSKPEQNARRAGFFFWAPGVPKSKGASVQHLSFDLGGISG